MGNPALRLVSPSSEKQTILARRRPNAEYRTREYLPEHEVEQLIEATKSNRQAHRDGTMILLAFRHGLRATEVCDLRWEQVEFETAVLHVRRRKNGTPSVHPLSGRELRALRRLRRETQASPFIFVSERGSPFTVAGFQKLIARAGQKAGFEFPVHPHMLRHACGYALANAGQDTRALQAYLGHRCIQHTVRYTELSPERFKRFWRD
jgi:integrase